MKRKQRFLCRVVTIALAVLLIAISDGGASSVSEASLDEMIDHAQLIFEGAVTAVQARESSPKRIHTLVSFRIIEVIRGEWNGDTITLSFLGGTVDGRTLAVSDMRLPEAGEEGIYFVESLERRQVNPLYGWSQGHLILERDTTGIRRVMTNRRWPVTGVTDDAAKTAATPEKTGIRALSTGVARDLVVGKGRKGLTVEEFKKVLRERIGRR